MNNTIIEPDNSTLGANGLLRGLSVRLRNEAGMENVTIFSDGNVSYILLMFWVLDHSEFVTKGDVVIAQSTEPLAAGATYKPQLITELNS